MTEIEQVARVRQIVALAVNAGCSVEARGAERQAILDGITQEAVDSLLNPIKPEGWRPIETAPKDGTEVFLYFPDDSLYPTAGRYDTREYFEREYGDPDYMEEGWRWSNGYPAELHEEVIQPTHWQPIPPPPVAP